MQKKDKAFIFDMNGTMIDDMAVHQEIWYDILTTDLRSTLSKEEVKLQMYGKNSELLERIFGKGFMTFEEMEKWSIEKEKRYQRIYLPDLKLIEGLDMFFDKAANLEIPMAIGSAAIMFNVDFVLDNLNIRRYFSAIVSADHVKESKPHPETFLKAAELMQVAPQDCIVFEDAPKGVEAARNAGMQCVVILTYHEAEDFKKYDNVIAHVKDYKDPKLAQLFEKVL